MGSQQWHEGRVPAYIVLSGGGGTFTPGSVDGNLIPSADLTWSIGSGSFRWTDLFAADLHSTTGTFSGGIVGASFTTAGTITGADLVISGAASTGALSAASLVVSGNASVTGSLTAGTLSVAALSTGSISATAINASSLTTTGNASIGGTLSASAPSFSGTSVFYFATASIAFSSDKLIASGQVETPQIWSSDYVRAAVDIKPLNTGVQSLGATDKRWQNIYGNNLYCSTGSITTLTATTFNVGTVTGTTVSTTRVGSDLIPNVNNVYNLGASSSLWNTAYITTVNVETLASGASTFSDSITGTSITLSGLLQAATLRATSTSQFDGAITALGGVSVTGTTTTGLLNASSITTTGTATIGSTLNASANCFISGNLSVGGIITSLIPQLPYELGSNSKPWGTLYVTDAYASTLQATTSVSTPLVKAISGNLALGSSLVPGGAVSLGVTGTRFPSAFVDALTVTNNAALGTLSVTGAASAGSFSTNGEVNINNKLWLGQAWETNYGIWAKGTGGVDTAIFKVEYNDLFGNTVIRNPNGTAALEIGDNNNVSRLTCGTFQINGLSVDNPNRLYAWITGNETHVNNIWHVVNFSSAVETVNTHNVLMAVGGLDLGTGPYVINVTTKTLQVRVDYWVEFDANATGYRGAEIIRDLTGGVYARMVQSASTTGPTTLSSSAVIRIPPNDRVYLELFQNSGGFLPVSFNMIVTLD